MFGPKWSQHIDKTRMLHDSIFISWISSSVAPTRTAPPEHSLFQGSFYFLHGETDVSAVRGVHPLFRRQISRIESKVAVVTRCEALVEAIRAP